MLAKSPLPPALPYPPVFREADASRINSVVNHDAVRPWVMLPGQDRLDLSDFVADPRNVVLMDEAGTVGIVFHGLEPGAYECHTAALPEARGATVLAVVRSMIAWMFTSTDCMELLTKCPAHNRPAEALAKAVGGALDFERPAAWPTDKGPVAVRYYALRYPEWVRTADLLPVIGEWFHERLGAENARLGIAEELHDDDAAHDRHAGAAVAMILAGQPAKGVILYNRWARFAGYGLASIANAAPVIIDIGTHLLRVHETGFEALRPGVMQ